VAVLLAASASAATSSSVSISGPHKVVAGTEVKLRFTGYAGTGVNHLRVWLDDRKCAPSASAESGRPELQPPAAPPTQFRVRRHFKDQLTVTHSSTGTHIVCAYLIYRATQNTAARASWRYVTH
jgi:hypothetical protein